MGQGLNIKGISINWISCLPVLFLMLLISSSFQPDAFALSIEDEKKMGEEFLANLRRNFELVEDDFANQYFNELGNYLIRPLETKPFDFHFYIIKSADLNAFAAPGGHIFFFSGLIKSLDDIDELTSVICHEIGHVSARHLSHRMDQSKKIGFASLAGMLLGMLVGGEAGSALVTGSMAAGIQAQLHFSREDEREADQLSFKYMSSLGFDPAGLIRALNKIRRESMFGPSEIPPYLLTHPTGPERMSNLDTMLSQYEKKPIPPESARFKKDFPAFRTLVLAEALEPRLAEDYFNNELEKKPASALPHLGLGTVFIRKYEYNRAIGHLEEAKKMIPGFSPIIAKLGKAYQMMGQEVKAVSILEEAIERDRGDKILLFNLAILYEDLKQYEKAIGLFAKLASYQPVKDDVYYHLGLSYGKLNDLALAHYNFGMYYKQIGSKEMAMFHFQKANSLSKNNPAMKERIHRESKGLHQKRSRKSSNSDPS